MKMSKMDPPKCIALAISILLGFQFASAAHAEEPVNAPAAAHPASSDIHSQATSEAGARITIDGFHAGLLEIMKHAEELGIHGRIEKLTPLMKRTFDLDFMASRTVGRYWRKLSDDEKESWIELFTRFTTANYAGRFTGFTGEEFITIRVEEAPRETQVVHSKIVVPHEEEVQLNYRLIERDGTWMVIDVFLNGTVSELALRRSEYASALKRDGFPKLVESVEAKIVDMTSDDLAEG